MFLFIYNYCKWNLCNWHCLCFSEITYHSFRHLKTHYHLHNLCCFVCERKCPLLAYLKNGISSIENRFRILLIQQIIRIYMALPGKIKPRGNNKDWQLCLINSNSLASREKNMMYFSSEAYQHLTKLVFVFLAHDKNSNRWVSLEGGGKGWKDRQLQGLAADSAALFCLTWFYKLPLLKYHSLCWELCQEAQYVQCGWVSLHKLSMKINYRNHWITHWIRSRWLPFACNCRVNYFCLN